jgi:hypothetical protein
MQQEIDSARRSRGTIRLVTTMVLAALLFVMLVLSGAGA